MNIRPATREDVPACVTMIEARRQIYETYEPRFWKKAANSPALTQGWFSHLFGDEKILSLVADDGTALAGFLIAANVPAPPVFDPGGPTALIDDFYVKSDDLWLTAGAALLDAAKAALKERGYAQIVVVGVQRDDAKNALLTRTDLSLASNWWTAGL
jgi:ribosomal protein S18 acetylase RimI-like enzyme